MLLRHDTSFTRFPTRTHHQCLSPLSLHRRPCTQPCASTNNVDASDVQPSSNGSSSSSFGDPSSTQRRQTSSSYRDAGQLSGGATQGQSAAAGKSTTKTTHTSSSSDAAGAGASANGGKAAASNGQHDHSSSGGSPGSSSRPFSQSDTQGGPQQEAKRVVVVGGGWGGFGAALAAAKAGAQVTLLDASPDPGGLSSTSTSASGQVIEPGIKGFWYGYNNTSALVEQELGLDPFTPFTSSSFWAPDGLQVTSPLFQDQVRLPTPLGSFLYTAPSFTNLTLPDRATALPLVTHLLRHNADDESYAAYDALSAWELFSMAGVSESLYKRFLEPMLLVTLFAPPTELSAAAALGALYYFALAHQADFDVRWTKGPIGTTIFRPLVEKLRAMGVTILGGQRVKDVLPAASNPKQVGAVTAVGPDGTTTTFPADAVILAVGVPPLQRLVGSSPLLASCSELRGVNELRCSDVLAVRLWLDRPLTFRTPSNVVAGFDAGVGGTLFHLNQLQDQYREAAGAVLEFDLYHANTLLPCSDDALVQKLMSEYLPVACPEAGVLPPHVQDASVLRAVRAVTQFSPGSAAHLPPICVGSCAGLYVAGDCVEQGPGTHGAKGLSQEKAYVTGLQAGNAAARGLGLRPAARVLPVEPDEPHVAAAKQLLSVLRPPLPVGWSGRPMCSSSAGRARV